MNLVQVFVEEDGDLERGAGDAEPGDTHASVTLQAEQGPQALLASPRRRQLDQEVRDLAPDVPEAVRHARRNNDSFPRAYGAPSPAETKAKRTRDSLEPLYLTGVDVHRNESTGSHEELGGDALARPLPKHDPLPGERIVDCIYMFDRLI